MTAPKPPPSIEDIRVPDYFALVLATKSLLMSLDRSVLYDSWVNDKENPRPHPPYPEPIAEARAEAYANARMLVLKETVTPSFTPNQIREQIDEIGKAAQALADALLTAPSETTSAINAAEAKWQDPFGSPVPTLADCERIAQFLATKARNAKSSGSTKSRSGRAPSLMTQNIARLAAADFFEITGREPSRSGNKHEFPEFLERLFIALQLKTKSSSYAQDAVDGWRAHRNGNVVAPVKLSGA